MSEPTGITALKIKNFQAHESFQCELDPGVNTLVGPSDVGKSSVMRALRWVTTNSPAGDAFIRWGEKEAVVGIKVDGKRVVRRKGKGNTYAIDDREFVSFGHEVPDEVAELLRLGDANFQGQYDSPFWLGETAGEVARQLNQVVNLEIIDTTLSELSSQVRETAARKSVVEDRIQVFTDKVDEWDEAVAMQVDWAVIEVMPIKIRELREWIGVFAKLIEDVERATERERHLWACAKAIKLVVAAADKWQEGVAPLHSLTHLIQRLQSAEREPTDVPDAAVLVLLEQESRDLKQTEDDILGLDAAIRNFQIAHTASVAVGADLRDMSGMLKRAIGKECQLCHQPIP